MSSKSGCINELNKPGSIYDISEEELRQFLKDYKIDINPNLDAEDRNSFLKCLYEYRDVFAQSYKDIKIYIRVTN